MLDFDLNWPAVLVAGAFNFIYALIWFGMFETPWLRLTGISKQVAQQNKRAVAIFAGSSLLTAAALGVLLETADVTDVTAGALWGALAWVGFTAGVALPEYAFSKRSFKLLAINTLGYLITFSVQGSLLAGWQ